MSDNTVPNWQKQLRYNPVPALLAAKNQAIVYFTKQALVGEKVEPIHTVWELPEPQKVLAKQQADGSWQRSGKNKEVYRTTITPWSRHSRISASSSKNTPLPKRIRPSPKPPSFFLRSKPRRGISAALSATSMPRITPAICYHC